MFTRKRLLIALAVLIVAVVVVDSWKVVRPWSVDQLVISRNTTFIEEPLRADGYPDYIAFLNERLSEGVTPENNAAVPLLRAVGPKDIEAAAREEFYRRLGIEPLSETATYFVDWPKFMKPLPEDDEVSVEFYEQATGRPWNRNEFPPVAKWLERNEARLELAVTASRLSRFYAPLVSTSNPPTLVSVVVPLLNGVRHVSQALTIRAMLHLENGDVDAAWNDLMAVRRLGRLMGQGGTLVETLVGYAIEGMAVAGQETVLAEAELSAERCIEMQKQLDELAPLPKLADKLDQCERLSLLDIGLALSREGPESLAQLVGNSPFAGIATRGVNWNVTLEIANQWMDRMVDAARIEDPRVRAAESARIESDIKNLGVNQQGKGKALVSRGQASERNGEILVTLVMPALSALAQAEARTKTDHDLLRVGVALAHFKAENRQYPESLAELVPKYITTLPVDAFAGTPFVYRRRPSGYLLYSPGPNLRDEEGRGHDENGDDHFIEIPRRVKPKPEPTDPGDANADAPVNPDQ